MKLTQMERYIMMAKKLGLKSFEYDGLKFELKEFDNVYNTKDKPSGLVNNKKEEYYSFEKELLALSDPVSYEELLLKERDAH